MGPPACGAMFVAPAPPSQRLFQCYDRAMAKITAGVLLYRFRAGRPEVFLVHPGGPFWAKKDAGAWSIPKGEYGEGDDPAARAEEEFAEELGEGAPPGPRLDLGEVRQAGGKRV